MANLISIDKILRENAKKYYKFIPKFIIRYLERVVHQEEINTFILKNEDVYGNDFIYEVLKLFNTKIEIQNIEKVPKKRRYIFVSNHPLGGLDGVAFIHIIHKFFGPVKAVVNELLLYLKNLKPVFEGVNVFGGFSKKQLIQLENLYQGDNHIIIFPAGTVSRKIKGKIQDIEWTKSFISKAIKYSRDIIPVYITGRNSNFFYNFAKVRKFFGIKFPVELIYLPDEMFNYRNKVIKFTFGKPIAIKEIKESNKNHEYWKNRIREIVYNLAKAN